LQLNIAGFLKGGKSLQTAHRNVRGGMYSAPEPKPKSSSIIAVLKGIRQLQICGTVYQLHPGMAIWFNGNIIHNGMDNPEDSLALHTMHVDDKHFHRVAYDLDLDLAP
jgi:quercetin dioxygenase-like cupin family protein